LFRQGIPGTAGVGEAGDPYERHADAVADRVVRGEYVDDLLSTRAGPTIGGATAVQRKPDDAAAGPKPGINKSGFIDHGGGAKVREEPLPPATRVFVTGTHPSAPEWLYVTATLSDRSMVRGYGQGNVITGYGPSGIKGESGAAALGGAAGDAGQPITDAMITGGTIPVALGRPPVPKANQVAP
jgi:hypothetical protein